MEQSKGQKGIALIVLIITIVALLLLAVVAINFIVNNKTIEQPNNSVTESEDVQKNDQPSNYEATEVPDDLLDYVLGADRQGKSLSQLLNESSNKWLDEAGNVREDITTLGEGYNEDYTKVILYIKCDNVAYRIIAKGNEDNLGENVTDSIEKVYEPQGREGKIVEGGTYDGWIILTDRDGLVEIVSPDTVGDPLTLGIEDTAATADFSGDKIIDDKDTAILSYYNAIKTINNYCKQVMNSSNVRSVGGTDNKASAYSSENYENWGSRIKAGIVSGDMKYELDLVKLAYFGKLKTTNNYWIASRSVKEFSNYVYFFVRNVRQDFLSGDFVCGVMANGTVYGYKPSYSVRPVVINPEGI